MEDSMSWDGVIPSLYYTGVGSRRTPTPILNVMRVLGRALAEQGWVLRSGGAAGADTAFEEGALAVDGSRLNIYLPWASFWRDAPKQGPTVLPSWCDVPTRFKNYEHSLPILVGVYPRYKRVSMGAQKLHRRNVYQVLGDDLATPSQFMIYWAEPTGDGVRGGTNTAFLLSQKYGVPTYNLYNESTLAYIVNLIETKASLSVLSDKNNPYRDPVFIPKAA